MQDESTEPDSKAAAQQPRETEQAPEADDMDTETLDEDGRPKVEGTQDAWTDKAQSVIGETDDSVAG
jgi:hypothetical protein